MKRYILILITIALGIYSKAQEYKVESFEIAPKDLSARTEGRVDGNGRKCAVIKVYVQDAITDTDGPVVGEIRDRGMEKWIYVTHDAKQIRLLFKEHMPLCVTFDDYNYSTLSGNMTYIMILKEAEKDNSSLGSTMPIQESSTPLSTQASPSVHSNNPASDQVSSSNVRHKKGDSSDDLDIVIQNLINNMVYIEGGSFKMGSNDSEASKEEKPVHKETVNSFSIGKYEVTQKEWEAVMGNNPSRVKGDNLPVFDVSWYECQEFIRKLNILTGKNFRLPTEAEWEYASKGGNRSKGYKYSGSDEINKVAWYSGNSENRIPGSTFFDLIDANRRAEQRDPLSSYTNYLDRIRNSTHDVGTKDPNELGIHDMSGSVWEWTSSNWNDNYKKPRNSTKLVMRGGGWLDLPHFCRVSNRWGRDPQWDTFPFLVGLRLAL